MTRPAMNKQKRRFDPATLFDKPLEDQKVDEKIEVLWRDNAKNLVGVTRTKSPIMSIDGVECTVLI